MNLTLDQAREKIENKIKKLGFSIDYRSSLSGVVYRSTKKCLIPQIKTRKSLYIGCHELFHCLRKRQVKVYINEMLAERFAHRFMRHLGFAVPRSQTQRAKRYVSWKLAKAQRRGLQLIDNEVKRFIKY